MMVTFEWSDWRNGWFWWIQSVYVKPEHRRKGVIRALYAHVSNLARQRKALGLRLYVDKQNEAGQKTYAALGMSRANYDFYHVEFLRLKKRLRRSS